MAKADLVEDETSRLADIARQRLTLERDSKMMVVHNHVWI